VSGFFSDGLTTFTPVESAALPITVDNLAEGTWNITVDGLNATGGMVSTKTQNVVIASGQETSATFILELPEGTGTASVTIRWPSTVTSFSQIRGTITPTVIGKEGFTVETSSATSSEGVNTIIQTIEGLPTGSYQFKLEVLGSQNNPVGLSYRESLNIYKNMTSSKTYDIPAVVFPIETPVISIDDSYQVSITCATETVTIYYTTNGSEPGPSSTVYSTPFTISQNTIVKAIAMRTDRFSSAIAESLLEVLAAAPTFSLSAATYDTPQTVTLSTTTSGGIIYYTVDGSTPTSGSTEYTQVIAINENTLLKAVTTHVNYSNSVPSTAEYKIKAAAPTFSLAEGSHLGPQQVALTSTTADAAIYYTLDGTDPTNGILYSSSIQISNNATLRAVAKKAKMENSPIVERSYIILEKKVSTPTFSPEQGTFSIGQSVTISSETPDATIYYTLNGNAPSASGTLYTGPFSLTESTTIKAIAVKASDWADSDIATSVYTLQAVSPVISLASATYQSAQNVSLSTSTSGAVIYYTLDGSDPTTSQTRMQYSQPISIDRGLTLRAVAVKSGWTTSTVSTATYLMYVAPPVFSKEGGTYAAAQSVAITSTTPGATIHYTTDGSDPTTSSLTYSSAVNVDATKTLKAIAIKNGCTNSTISSATYTIQGSSGISVVDLPNYSVAIQLPSGWEGNTVVTGAVGIVTAVVTPTPTLGSVTYSWYLDGEIAKNRLGSIASTSNKLKFGNASDEVYLESGPHVLSVEITHGSISFSDQKVMVISPNGIGVRYRVGDIGPAGGYVFYDKGVYSSGWRYLEAAPARWNGTASDPSYIFGYYRNSSMGSNLVIGTGFTTGSGEGNTSALVTAMQNNAYISQSEITTTPGYAAKMCYVHSVTVNSVVYSDWFLPSKEELNLMYLNLKLKGLGGFLEGAYWSSSESNELGSYLQFFNNGFQNYSGRSYSASVRPIRAF
jgi:hypothetical protein